MANVFPNAEALADLLTVNRPLGVPSGRSGWGIYIALAANQIDGTRGGLRLKVWCAKRPLAEHVVPGEPWHASAEIAPSLSAQDVAAHAITQLIGILIAHEEFCLVDEPNLMLRVQQAGMRLASLG